MSVWLSEAFNPLGTKQQALLTLRLLSGLEETQGVLEMYGQAARDHGADCADCREAVERGKADRAVALEASESTPLTVDEILADLHLDLVQQGYGALYRYGKDSVADEPVLYRTFKCERDRGTQYLVCDENTLCYQHAGSPRLGVLAGIGQFGRDWRSGSTIAGTFSSVREAVFADFEKFLVSPKGHTV